MDNCIADNQFYLVLHEFGELEYACHFLFGGNNGSSSLDFEDYRIGAIDDNHIGAKSSKTPRLMYPSGIELKILISVIIKIRALCMLAVEVLAHVHMDLRCSPM